MYETISKQPVSVGSTQVELSFCGWERYERFCYEVRIHCVGTFGSDYDGIRNDKPSVAEVRNAVDWIIGNEDQEALKGYTEDQIKNLHAEIIKLIDANSGRVSGGCVL